MNANENFFVIYIIVSPCIDKVYNTQIIFYIIMFEQLMRDKVSLIKSDGRRFENIISNVGPESIAIHDVSLPIEEGDRFLRTLPNGLEEYYVVRDRGYHQALGIIPARYNVKVTKENKQDIKETVSTTYNLTGNNSRMNIHSNDYSINVQIDETNVFEELKKTIEKNISNDDEKAKFVSNVEKLKSTQNTQGFTESYKEFIALAANHMTIIAPFIPYLTLLLKLN